MVLDKTYWAIITSHHIWVFLRRLENPSAILYSPVECQAGNTRPFRALMATLLAAGGLITIPQPPQIRLTIPTRSSKKRSYSGIELGSMDLFSNDNRTHKLKEKSTLESSQDTQSVTRKPNVEVRSPSPSFSAFLTCFYRFNGRQIFFQILRRYLSQPFLDPKTVLH